MQLSITHMLYLRTAAQQEYRSQNAIFRAVQAFATNGTVQAALLHIDNSSNNKTRVIKRLKEAGLLAEDGQTVTNKGIDLLDDLQLKAGEKWYRTLSSITIDDGRITIERIRRL